MTAEYKLGTAAKKNNKNKAISAINVLSDDVYDMTIRLQRCPNAQGEFTFLCVV